MNMAKMLTVGGTICVQNMVSFLKSNRSEHKHLKTLAPEIYEMYPIFTKKKIRLIYT